MRRTIDAVRSFKDTARRIIYPVRTSADAARRAIYSIRTSKDAMRRLICLIRTSADAARRVICGIRTSADAVRRVIGCIRTSAEVTDEPFQTNLATTVATPTDFCRILATSPALAIVGWMVRVRGHNPNGMKGDSQPYNAVIERFRNLFSRYAVG